jgi:hypothetical protein
MWPFGVNAVSYLVSVLTLLGIRADLRANTDHKDAAATNRSLREEIGDGVRFVWAQRALRDLVLLSALITLLSGGLTLVVIVLLTHQGSSPTLIGIIFGGCGAAGLTGAAITPQVVKRTKPGHAYIASLATSSGLIIAMSMSTSPLWVGLSAAGIVGIGPVPATVVQLARAHTIPAHMFARVRSVETLITCSTAPLASLTAGASLSRFGPATTCLLIGAGLALATVLALAAPGLRQLDTNPT